MSQLTLVREIRARPSTVFDLLSSAEGLTSWWGPDDLPVIFAQAQVRVGGAYRVRFSRTDGGVHECAGEFLEIEPPSRMVMSWRWTLGGVPQEAGRTSRVEFHLRAIDTGTELTLVHAELCDAASASSHTEGWAGALEKLCQGLSRSHSAETRGRAA